MRRKNLAKIMLASVCALSLGAGIMAACNNGGNSGDGGNGGNSNYEEEDKNNTAGGDTNTGADNNVEQTASVLFTGMTASDSVETSTASVSAVAAAARVGGGDIGESVHYSQFRNESFYLAVKFDNPNECVIQKFTLSYADTTKSYAVYMFEQGSDFETVYVKVTARGDTAVTEYTISNMMYIDSTDNSIKQIGVATNASQKISIGIKDVRDGITLSDDVITDLGESYAINKMDDSFISNGVLTIPSEYNGKPITKISKYAFTYEKEITSVIIPDSVTYIDEGAFYQCENLKSVTLGSGITFIGRNAFYYDEAINYVNYTGDLESWLNIQFTYTLDEQIENLDKTNFNDKEARYANPTFFAHDLHIKGELVTEVIVPDSVDRILLGAFERCYSITKLDTNNATTIGYYAFLTGVGLNDVKLTNVNTIDASAFNGCYSITSIELPVSLFRINGTSGNAAFWACNKLLEVYDYTPAGLAVKGSSANGAVALNAKKVYRNETPESTAFTYDNGFIWYSEEGDDNNILLLGYTGTATEVVVPKIYGGKNVELAACVFAGNQTITKVTIEVGFTEVADRMFAYCGNLVEVVLPSTITKIPEKAFLEVKSLGNLIIPASCTTIDTNAFQTNKNLEITINNKNTVFGSKTFSNNVNLTVNFAGTIAEWKAIAEDELGSTDYKGVMYNCESFTIKCTDGTYKTEE